MAKALIVEIIGDARHFASELDKAAGKTRRFSAAAGVAGTALIGGLALGLEKSVKAAAEMQVSTAKMDQAFKSSGENVKSYASQINKAESQGRNFGFTNSDLRDSLGSLEIATHNGTKAIKDLGVAEDIARFKHVGLTDASKMLTMAMAGSQRATKALGLSLQPVTAAEDKVKEAFKKHSGAAYAAALATAKLQDKQATAAQVIDLVKEKLHGQAKAFADTAQGGAARLHAQLNALEENLGSALLPGLTAVAGALATATGWLAKHTTIAKILVGVLGSLGAILLAVAAYEKILHAAQVLGIVATEEQTAASVEMGAAMDVALGPIGLVILGITALAVAFKVAWDHSKTFRGIVLGVWADVKSVTSTVVNFFTQKIPAAFESILGWFRSHWKTIAVLISGPFAPLVALATNAFGIRDKLVGAFDAVKNTVKTVFGAIPGIIKAAAGLIRAAVGPIIGAIQAVINALQSLVGWAKSAIGFLSDVFTKSHGAGPPGGPRGPGPPVRRHAAGGIVTAPQIGMIGEAGPEAIIPLSSPKARGMLGGGEVHVHVGPVYGTVDAGFARTLQAELATQLKNGGAPQLAQAIRFT